MTSAAKERVPSAATSSALVAVAAGACGALLVWAPPPLPGVVLVGIGTGACLLLLQRERRGEGPRVREVVFAIGAVMSVAVLLAPRGSHDLWSYVMYGRTVAVHHSSPYANPPSDFPTDPFLARVSGGWRSAPSVYGPLFTAYSSLGALVAGESALLARLCHQLLAAGSLGGILALVWRRVRSPAALALVGLHPAIAVVALNGGHNDLVVGFLIMGAALLTAAERRTAAGLVVGTAVLVKATAGLALVGLVVWQLRRHDVRAAARLALAAVLVAGIGYLAAGRAAWAALGGHAANMSRASVWQLARAAFGVDAHHAVFGLARAGLLEGLGAAAALAVLIGGAVLAWRVAGRDDATQSALAVTASYQFGAAYTLPWYAAWSLPLAALRPHSRLTAVLAVQAAFLAAAYELPQGLPPVRWVPDARVAIQYVVPPLMLAWFVVAAWHHGRSGAERPARSLRDSLPQPARAAGATGSATDF